MPIKLQCPECKTVAAAPEGRAGQHVRCKRCNTKFPIPHGAPTLPVPAASVGRVLALPESPTVIDRYEVRELLGAGSYGSVYGAFDPRLGREVALKVLRAEMTSSPQAVERFLREAKAAAKLDHPNIVAVFDAGRAGDVYFIASAFIKGGTLASSIPQTGMEPRRAAELAGQLASALGYAHRQGVVHRDVKPANILLDEQGSLRLMDFGLAGWTRDECTRLTQQGAVMGTPAYMAPEQAAGDTAVIGPASDLYSAGVVLYELLTGRRPFGGDNAASMIYQIVHTQAPPPSQHRLGLDAALEAVCLKAMAKKPAERFTDGEAMAAALRLWAPTAILMAVPLASPVIPSAPPLGASTPSAIPIAEPVATQNATALPPSVWEWVSETVDPPAVRTIKTSPAPSTLPWKRNRQSSLLANQFEPKWKLWAVASVGVLTAVTVVVTVLYLWRPSTGASRANGAPKSISSKTEEKSHDEYVNSFAMNFVLIKPGVFLMGSSGGEGDEDERPQHEVEITRPFYLGVYPVTQAEYVQVSGKKNPSNFSKEGPGKAAVKDFDTSRFPVERVSWDDAMAFCAALNQQDAMKLPAWSYGLPTEAEWEFACRAGSKTTYFFGGDPNELDAYAWHRANSESRTHAVGTRKPNPWGLFDMNGNVLQWCADWYDKDYYRNCPIKDPQCVVKGEGRVFRGGGWFEAPEGCTAACRNAIAPDDRRGSYGMRICLHQN